MSASEDELEFSDVNSVDSELSSSPEYEIERESDGSSTDPSTSDGEEDAAAFAEEPLADAEWTAEYERERKADEEMEKTLRDRLEALTKLCLPVFTYALCKLISKLNFTLASYAPLF